MNTTNSVVAEKQDTPCTFLQVMRDQLRHVAKCQSKQYLSKQKGKCGFKRRLDFGLH